MWVSSGVPLGEFFDCEILPTAGADLSTVNFRYTTRVLCSMYASSTWPTPFVAVFLISGVVITRRSCIDRPSLRRCASSLVRCGTRNPVLNTRPNMTSMLAHTNSTSYLGEIDEWGEENGCRERYTAGQMHCSPFSMAAGFLRG